MRVWIGCLACYNGGRLMGEWYEASEAGEVTPETIHGRATSHEELWCFDIENAPQGHRNEMSPMEAQAIADVLDSFEDETEAEAFAAYCAYTGESFEEDAVSGFRDAFMGHRESFREYADELAEETLSQYHIDNEHFAYRYFDWDSHANDLLHGGYWTEDAGGGGVFVFAD